MSVPLMGNFKMKKIPLFIKNFLGTGYNPFQDVEVPEDVPGILIVDSGGKNLYFRYVNELPRGMRDKYPDGFYEETYAYHISM